MDKIISLKHVTKRYGRKIALQDVSLSLEKGRIYGIIGENGAGKSTLFRCVTGLEKHDGDIGLQPGTTIGYLPDSHYFYPLMKGQEYIDFCLKARGMAADRKRTEQLNGMFRLPLADYISSYSLGMKKRLVLMALLLQDNDLHILDEPFNGLDLTGVIFLKRRIREVAANEGKTFLLSSHILSSLTETCDEICYLHEGRIVRTYGKEEFGRIEEDISKQTLP